MKNKAVFVDRDGTINVDVHYLNDPDKFEMYPGVGEGMKILHDKGFKIIVITNQSGIARGYFTEKQLSDIHERMKQEFQKFAVALDGIYYCPHHPDDRCNCRKPKPGLLIECGKKYNIDFKSSFLVGDKCSDILAGRSVGCKTILVKTGHGLWEYENKKCHVDYVAADLFDAVQNFIV